MSAIGRPAVMHLVWGPLGSAPLRDFVRSYREHDAGAPHELVVVLNGVQRVAGAAAVAGPGAVAGAAAVAGPGMVASRAELLAELEGTEHRLIELERPMLDLPAYRTALAQLEQRRVCILNSHSRIRADGWLAALEGALDRPGVGLAGASGSWASMRSYALYHARLPSAYGRVWPDRTATLEGFRALDRERTGAPPARWALRHLYTARALLDMTIGFPSFPAPHVRTNAFIAERRLLADALGASLRRKVDTHRMESGSRGLTRRVQQAGLRAVVVDRSARSFEVEEWPDSETFWQRAQDGLLVADNQTDSYEQSDAERRRLLSTYAWGERARPSPPAS